jgi:glycosyltransferase involved in cell wall biosynthesis
MKLIIQIPCFNEEKTLSQTLKDLPKKIDGIDEIETLVINDGSTDKTEDVARSLGIKQILSLKKRRGLAYAFRAGLDRAVELGADMIVNTDGDNQYRGDDVRLLVEPILKNRAQVAIGCRDISNIRHFSFTKKMLQYVGSQFVRKFSNTDVRDSTSGFRAYSRDAALRINIFSDYTYTLESIIQLGRIGVPMECVDVRTNPKLRESHLMKSVFGYVMRSTATVLKIYLMYEPLKSFFLIGAIPVLGGCALVVRFLMSHFTRTTGGGHVQSMIIASVLILLGFGIMTLGLVGDIISANRKLSEEILYKLKTKRLP